MNAIGIIAATRWEAHAIRRAAPSFASRRIDGIPCWGAEIGGRSCWLVQTGIGPKNAATVMRRFIALQPLSCIVSSGFACALTDADVGDLLVGQEVIEYPAGDRTGPILCSRHLASRALEISDGLQLAAQAGRFVSARHVVWCAEEKRAIACATQGLGLDMESGTLAALAEEAGIAFAVIRTVSDVRDEDLPLDFNLFLRPTGWMTGLASCLRHPSSLSGLSRLRRQSRVAGMHLTRFYERFLTVETTVTLA